VVGSTTGLDLLFRIDESTPLAEPPDWPWPSDEAISKAFEQIAKWFSIPCRARPTFEPPSTLLSLPELDSGGVGKFSGEGAPPPPCGALTNPAQLLHQPLRTVDMPSAERRWVENVVSPWIREGTYVNDVSRAAYAERVARVPRYLAAVGFPEVYAPTEFRREHIEALKYRAKAVGGPNQGRPLAPTYVVPLLSSLHDCLAYWARHYRSVDLLALVSDDRLWRTKKPVPVRRSRSLDALEDLERLTSRCDAATQVGVVLGAYSGLRVGEITGDNELSAVEKRDLELALDRPSWVTVRHGKEAKPRRAPVPPVARNVLLSATLGLDPTARVYPYSAWRFRRDLAEAGRAAGLSHVHPHRLRATFITFALRAGVPQQVVMDWAGHEKAETSRGYSDRDPVIEARGRTLYEAYLEGRSA